MDIYKPIWGDSSIEPLFDMLCKHLMTAPSVDTGHWQAKKGVPQVASRELVNVVIELPIYGTPGSWAGYMHPNLPWAEDHFKERVGGKPLNPPPSHIYWPYNQRGNEDHMQDEQFSHTYPERLWPRFAGNLGHAKAQVAAVTGQRGIRFEYGDLGDAVSLLVQEPHTRQCFIPIWFPEDLHAAAVENQRVPCTLGYHMMLRANKLHCFYPIRSLDLMRYFKDDAYMAGRLAQWLIKECRYKSGENSVWQDAEPGLLTMHAVSLHIFEGDVPLIKMHLDKKHDIKAAA